MNLFSDINNEWTLFLDRDGVINKKLEKDYVKNLDELELLPGSIEAIVRCGHYFGRVVIVTNQQGISKGLMTEGMLYEVHDEIYKKVESAGGKIDKIYFAPQLASENPPLRKPNIGMALAAQKDFPEIDFSKSIIVGDSESDMKFGENAGMVTIFISKETHDDYYTLNSLAAFADKLESVLLNS